MHIRTAKHTYTHTHTGTFLDSFRILCISPAVDLLVQPLGTLSNNPTYLLVPLEVTMNSLSEYTNNSVLFAYAENWFITSITPSSVPTMGGTYITLRGPYFRATEEIMCRFGSCPDNNPDCPEVLYATEVIHVNDNMVICRTPTVKIHQRINVSITLDGQYWSTPSNTTEIEFYGVRNTLTFGENGYGQLGFGVTGDRIFSGSTCVGGRFHGFDCVRDTDCPAGRCVYETRNLNYYPTFLKQLFAKNVTSIAMSQTHTMLVSSETYNDTWSTQPRKGLIYSWGDNLVGQLGLGFAGASIYQYNFTLPYVLVCPTETVYLLDRRVDERAIVGLPVTWPNTEWIVPTCNIKQDIKVDGVWGLNTFILYNPFYYATITRVVAGSFHAMALTSTGDLYTWGWNTDSQLGQGPVETRASITYPTHVFYFRRRVNVDIVSMSAGFAHSAAVGSDGNLYTWGNNKYGQLGLGDYQIRSFPTLVTGFVDSSGAVYKVRGTVAAGVAVFCERRGVFFTRFIGLLIMCTSYILHADMDKACLSRTHHRFEYIYMYARMSKWEYLYIHLPAHTYTCAQQASD
jgi:hypothetical protein